MQHVEDAPPFCPVELRRREPRAVRWGAVPWQRLWWTLVALLVVALTWHDLLKLASGLSYLAAERLHQNQQTGAALDLLSYAKRLSPDFPLLYNKEGILLADLPHGQGGAMQFARALAVDESHGPALNNLAVSSFAEGELDKAVKLQQRAVASEPNNAQIRYNLGVLFIEQGKLVAAAHAFREATRIAPNWPRPYVQLSTVQLALEDFARAEQAARKALRLAPLDQMAHTALIVARFHQHKHDEMLKAVEVAAHLFPTDQTITFYTALALQKTNRSAAAQDMLRAIFFSTDDHQLLVRVSQEYLTLLNQKP